MGRFQMFSSILSERDYKFLSFWLNSRKGEREERPDAHPWAKHKIHLYRPHVLCVPTVTPISYFVISLPPFLFRAVSQSLRMYFGGFLLILSFSYPAPTPSVCALRELYFYPVFSIYYTRCTRKGPNHSDGIVSVKLLDMRYVYLYLSYSQEADMYILKTCYYYSFLGASVYYECVLVFVCIHLHLASL